MRSVFMALALSAALTLSATWTLTPGENAEAATTAPTSAASTPLSSVARSERQWTGVAVAQDGRIFANYPRWSENVPVSVVLLAEPGTEIPYPDATWNSWKPGDDPKNKFVCVQSVYATPDGNLWILDPASPKIAGVVPGGPKLVQVDLNTNKVARVYSFPPEIAPEKSYLNDVRISRQHRRAYMTDSGLGAIVVLDLDTGRARRLLDNHKSTTAENTEVVIDGKKWLRNGESPVIHSDGIALDPNERYLYYQALTGRTMYRVPVDALNNEKLNEQELAAAVETVGTTGVADGIEFGADGNLYITSLEKNAISRLTPEGKAEVFIQRDDLHWPDSFAVGPDGRMFVTTSQIHLQPNPPGPYQIFSFQTIEPAKGPTTSTDRR